LGVFNLLLFSGEDIKTVDQSKTIIQCNLGAKESFTAKSINLNLNNSDFIDGQFNYKSFFEGYNNYNIEKILNECYPKRRAMIGNNYDIYDDQKEAELIKKYGFLGYENSLTQEQKNTLDVDYNTYKQQTNTVIGNDKAKFLDFSFNMFDIKPVFTYIKFLFYFFLGNFMILLVFEVLKRVFYYIILGTFRPHKK